MEQNTEHKHRPTQVELTDFLIKVQKQSNGVRIVFLTNGAGANGYSKEKEKKRT